MKRCITDYLIEATQHNTNIFYEILEHKYRKFIFLYWLLKDYSDEIKEFTYVEQPIKEKLSVTIKISGKHKNQLMKDIDCILDNEGTYCDIEVVKQKSGLDIVLTQDEI